jgi:hypothetical protein
MKLGQVYWHGEKLAYAIVYGRTHFGELDVVIIRTARTLVCGANCRRQTWRMLPKGWTLFYDPS